MEYPYILSDIRDWPIYKLSQDREVFMKEVEDEVTESLSKSKKKGALNDEIAKVLFLERQRIKDDPWKVDPKDDPEFWKDVRKQLLDKSLDNSSDEEVNANNEAIVRKIVGRYTQEITGSFQVSSYRLARRLLTATFRTVLNAASFRTIRSIISDEQLLNEKVKIAGPIEMVRGLASKGTIVLVPTHFSNLDSVLIGWAADRVGLPAFSYGAGLNLYNSSLFAFFMRRLGAYTLDRRKKNSFYLETIKSFSKMTILRGVNTLFFPGGTRSRSGQLESKLKMGLLGSVLDAQCQHYEEGRDHKIYVVPLVINYHFVLEAKSLIQQHLSHTGKELYISEKNPFGGYFGFLKFFFRLFRVSSEIVLSFGKPLDVMGNFVDAEGNSLDQFGDPVEIKEYFISEGVIKRDRQRNEQYTQRLADTLVERFYAENVVLTSHLLAHTAFAFFKKRNPDLDLYGVLRLSKEESSIPAEVFEKGLEQLLAHLLVLAEEGKVKLSYPLIHGTIQDIIQHGLPNLGAYHSQKVLYKNYAGEYATDDMHLLLYYHNRLEGYGIAKYLS